MEKVDAVVVGAGVVGLAIARALALAGREVLVLEPADAIGTETSARNSEVVHAGIYYPPGSLKARLCVEGRQRLTIHAPLMQLNKAAIVREGLRLGVDYAASSSCYDPADDGRPCGACDACLLRAKGFAEAGITDPLLARFGPR